MSATTRISENVERATEIDDLRVLARHIAGDTDGKGGNYGKDRAKLGEQHQLTIAEVNEALSVVINRSLATEQEYAAVQRVHSFLLTEV